MSTMFHDDPVARETIITRYLSHELDEETKFVFESHLLFCQDCYEETRATELLLCGLGQPLVEQTEADGIEIIRFQQPAELTGASSELSALVAAMEARGDKKVLIDLSKVSRIDSAGLGALMGAYTHAIRNSGVLKVLHPSDQVKKVLSITRIDSVLPAFEDEKAALTSFSSN